MLSRNSPIMPVYRRTEITMVRGEGVYLFDNQGKKYLDFAAGIAVNAFGHSHPALVAAMQDQVGKLWHCSNWFKNEHLEEYSQRLVDLAGLDKVFFCNSGAEAAEAAIKFTRRYFDKTGRPERYRIIVAEGAYHGRTLATLSANRNPRAIDGYAPLVDFYDIAAFNDIAALEASIGPETAAIMLEPVQGEGGIRPHSAEYLRAARTLCDKHGLLLIFDEVQCGLGRTGTMFAFEAFTPLPEGEVGEHRETGEGKTFRGTPSPEITYDNFDLSRRERLKPDILLLGKGLGNGFPLAACLTQRRVAEVMEPGCHGSTFGSNPLAMCAGLATLEEMTKPGFLVQVRAMSDLLEARLRALVAAHPQHYGEWRGMGLMQGITTQSSAYDLAAKLRENGLLTIPAGDNVLRFLPPLIIEAGHVEEAARILERVSG